ncbi:Peptidase family M1 domain [seawater metagenome]|uniref:Peptidase family M1 domain n=1 Tax=seawater metagenome TaxID=1561972 RepID=A0A5E8CIN9_9ZZZZ
MREIIPGYIKPVKYNLHLTPNLEEFTFSGILNLEFLTLQNTDKIELNSKEITISKAVVKYSNLSKYSVKGIEEDKDKERIIINLSQEIPKDTDASITIYYSGILNDEMAGFYRSKYPDSDEYMAVTQFEATDARRAFPCIDEPAVKAIFSLKLTVPNNLTALANTEIVKNESVGDIKTLTYADTPIMSTYLLAFYVGKVDYVEKIEKLESGKEILVKVYTPIGQKEQGVFALDLCGKVLKYFSEFFKIDYPLNKMDMIAIPDFAAGAMENWGLITYRSSLILYDPKLTSKENLIRIAYVICHELAHQWFGNLVTMSWWSELWLNEGFATWVGWLAVDKFFPEWKIWENFYLDEFCKALELDSLDNSHPIEVPIEKASQINEIFDAISYSKGACIIAMVVSIIGIEDFRNGIANYLRDNKYGNATTQDLWNFLSQSSGININEIMKNWIAVKGYPLIKLSKLEDQIVVSQTKFQDIDSIIKNETIWSVPLNILKNKEMKQELLNSKEMNLNLESPFKVNHDQNGFYIVQYHPELIPNIKDLNEIDRASILVDLFMLAKFGHVHIDQVYDIIKKHYTYEESYLVLEVLFSNLEEIKSVWYDNNAKKLEIEILESQLMENLLNKITIIPNKEESHQESLKRVLILKVAVGLKITSIIDKLNNLYDQDKIPVDLRGLVYKNRIISGKTEDVSQLIFKYNNTTSSTEQNKILSALGFSQSLESIESLLNMTLYGNGDLTVRTQDVPLIISSIAYNFKSRKFLWSYIKSNWDHIFNMLSNGSFLFGRVLTSSCSKLSSREELDDVKNFLQEKNIKTLEKTSQQIIEVIEGHITFKDRNIK